MNFKYFLLISYIVFFKVTILNVIYLEKKISTLNYNSCITRETSDAKQN